MHLHRAKSCHAMRLAILRAMHCGRRCRGRRYRAIHLQRAKYRAIHRAIHRDRRYRAIHRDMHRDRRYRGRRYHGRRYRCRRYHGRRYHGRTYRGNSPKWFGEVASWCHGRGYRRDRR